MSAWGNEAILWDTQQHLKSLGYRVRWVSTAEMPCSLNVWLTEGQEPQEVVSAVKTFTGQTIPAWAVGAELIKVHLSAPEQKLNPEGLPYDDTLPF